MSGEQSQGDFLLGAAKIAEFIRKEIGIPAQDHQVYHWAERDYLPIGKFGNQLVSTKTKLRRKFEMN